MDLACTLLGDGSSDQVLRYPIRWLLHDLCPNVAIQLEWADLGKLRRCPRTLGDRMRLALELHPAELLLVHRDAEGDSRDDRVAEIETASQAMAAQPRPPIVCVIPVRMTEAWLIFDEAAIREAAGNPRGATPLMLPSLRDVESVSDPKNLLKNLLLEASGLGSRRRQRFRVGPAVHRLGQVIDDYASLRGLSAFGAFEVDLRQKLVEGGWLGA